MAASPQRQRGMTLVELLVAIVVMGILTTMIVGSWITLTKAYSSASRSNMARDSADQAIARMAREIRDAQQVAGSATGAFVRTAPNEIRFYSTFNRAGNSNPASTPRLMRFVLRETDPVEHVGTVYREMAGSDGTFNTSDDVREVVTDVVNVRRGSPVFTYSAIDPITGQMYESSETTPVAPTRIQTVRLLLLVDLNPGKSPNYTDISTTVEPRNVRHL